MEDVFTHSLVGHRHDIRSLGPLDHDGPGAGGRGERGQNVLLRSLARPLVHVLCFVFFNATKKTKLTNPCFANGLSS